MLHRHRSTPASTGLPRRAVRIAAVALALSLPAAALASGSWLHVSVDEGEDTRIRVNVPLSILESVLPTIETDEFRDGRVHLGSEELDGVDVTAMLEALRDSEDGEYVTVRDGDEHIRVMKEDGRMLVRVEGDDENVRVQIPLSVVDALLEGVEEDGALNVAAAVAALGKLQGEDLVLVEEPDARIRVWIDNRGSQE